MRPVAHRPARAAATSTAAPPAYGAAVTDFGHGHRDAAGGAPSAGASAALPRPRRRRASRRRRRTRRRSPSARLAPASASASAIARASPRELAGPSGARRCRRASRRSRDLAVHAVRRDGGPPGRPRRSTIAPPSPGRLSRSPVVERTVRRRPALSSNAALAIGSTAPSGPIGASAPPLTHASHPPRRTARRDVPERLSAPAPSAATTRSTAPCSRDESRFARRRRVEPRDRLYGPTTRVPGPRAFDLDLPERVAAGRAAVITAHRVRVVLAGIVAASANAISWRLCPSRSSGRSAMRSRPPTSAAGSKSGTTPAWRVA